MPGTRKRKHIDLEFTLRRVFGKRDFRCVYIFNEPHPHSDYVPRPVQREVIEATLDGEDVFLQAATSFGKSLCYQLPAVVDFGSMYSIS